MLTFRRIIDHFSLLMADNINPMDRDSSANLFKSENARSMIQRMLLAVILLAIAALSSPVLAQSAAPGSERAKSIELGSRTAKGGFRNEDEIASKFNNWRADADATVWLGFMGYKPNEIVSVTAAKPHGEKADVTVRVKTKAGDKAEGISIKLVSSPNGFNQIDKRWLAHYAKMWRMPPDVLAALKLFVGETPPIKKGRDAKRMYLNELEPGSQKAVIDFFSANKSEIVSDLFKGDGEFSAGWLMVANKSGAKTRWVLRSIDHVIKYFGDGPVELTRTGNLKIGRITMQRKGGDGGRETAKMLQFKINPALAGL